MSPSEIATAVRWRLASDVETELVSHAKLAARTLLLTDLAETLSSTEQRIAKAVFDIAPELIDEQRSSLRDDGDFLFCKTVSVDDTRCPFEIHFGRGENVGRFNFYMGLGACVYNFEALGDTAKQSALGIDIEKFLKSRIACENHLRRGRVVRAIYSGDLLVIDSVKLEFRYTNYSWPPVRFQREAREYSPWLATPRL